MYGWTPLQYASHMGHHEIVELLVRTFNANLLNLQPPPLHLACLNTHKRVVERLLLAGADANVQD